MSVREMLMASYVVVPRRPNPAYRGMKLTARVRVFRRVLRSLYQDMSQLREQEYHDDISHEASYYAELAIMNRFRNALRVLGLGSRQVDDLLGEYRIIEANLYNKTNYKFGPRPLSQKDPIVWACIEDNVFHAVMDWIRWENEFQSQWDRYASIPSYE